MAVHDGSRQTRRYRSACVTYPRMSAASVDRERTKTPLEIAAF
jgi:hypothetical protein